MILWFLFLTESVATVSDSETRLVLLNKKRSLVWTWMPPLHPHPQALWLYHIYLTDWTNPTDIAIITSINLAVFWIKKRGRNNYVSLSMPNPFQNNNSNKFVIEYFIFWDMGQASPCPQYTPYTMQCHMGHRIHREINLFSTNQSPEQWDISGLSQQTTWHIIILVFLWKLFGEGWEGG